MKEEVAPRGPQRQQRSPSPKTPLVIHKDAASGAHTIVSARATRHRPVRTIFIHMAWQSARSETRCACTPAQFSARDGMTKIHPGSNIKEGLPTQCVSVCV